jgi:hypothetical protein
MIDFNHVFIHRSKHHSLSWSMLMDKDFTDQTNNYGINFPVDLKL